ncbi:LysR family transcriptional regulator [Croceibacterium xixiisoli]|uniref:LysR family transcriptional regulator n=1 Tax=Croceibacterium xixiisoli TaxID=1476466 RepID=UPI002E265808
MDVKKLRYFVTVASERSFTAAAARLNMSQPPLSRRIQEIEEQLGVPLFNRDSRPLTLTPAGRLFHEQALQVLQRVDEMAGTMKRFVQAERPRFVLGLIPSGFHDRLPEVIRRYQQLAPDIDFVLSEMSSLEQVLALKEGRIDAGLGRMRVEDAGIQREVLREEEVLAAMPPAQSAEGQAGDPVSLAEVARHRVILYPRDPRPSYADSIVSIFRDVGIQLDRPIEVREVQTALIMVAAGMGACLIPASARRLVHPEVICRPIRPAVTSPVVLSHRRDDTSPQLAMFIRTLAELYGEWGYASPILTDWQ